MLPHSQIILWPPCFFGFCFLSFFSPLNIFEHVRFLKLEGREGTVRSNMSITCKYLLPYSRSQKGTLPEFHLQGKHASLWRACKAPSGYDTSARMQPLTLLHSDFSEPVQSISYIEDNTIFGFYIFPLSRWWLSLVSHKDSHCTFCLVPWIQKNKDKGTWSNVILRSDGERFPTFKSTQYLTTWSLKEQN